MKQRGPLRLDARVAACGALTAGACAAATSRTAASASAARLRRFPVGRLKVACIASASSAHERGIGQHALAVRTGESTVADGKRNIKIKDGSEYVTGQGRFGPRQPVRGAEGAVLGQAQASPPSGNAGTPLNTRINR